MNWNLITETVDDTKPNYHYILVSQLYRIFNLSAATLVAGSMIINPGIVVRGRILFGSSVVSLRSDDSLLVFSNSVVSYKFDAYKYYCPYCLSMRRCKVTKYG